MSGVPFKDIALALGGMAVAVILVHELVPQLSLLLFLLLAALVVAAISHAPLAAAATGR